MDEKQAAALAESAAEGLLEAGQVFKELTSVLRKIGPLLGAMAADQQRSRVALEPLAKLATAAEKRHMPSAIGSAETLLDNKCEVAVPLGLLREARRALGETALDTGAQSG